MSIPLLSTLIFFPVLGGLSLLAVDRQQTGTIRLNGLTRSVAIAVGEAQVLVQ